MNQEVLPTVHYDSTGRRAFSVHDVGFAKNDGVRLEGYVSYSVNGGPLCSSTFEYQESTSPHTKGFARIEIEETHLGDVEGLILELMAEAKEAAAYRRDELKEMN